MNDTPINQHNIEIQKNLKSWNSKPILQKVYKHFYALIREEIDLSLTGKIVELGSGIGNLKSVIDNCITTDIFPNPWIDQVENAYVLSFEDNSVSHLILFDVFHHLEYPGNAFEEFQRVLVPNGRVIIFEPYISLFSYFIYEFFHHEPVKYFSSIQWFAPDNEDIEKDKYYAAQGNATRIFFKQKNKNLLNDWNVLKKKRINASYYIASGGYSKKQFYPDALFPFLLKLDNVFSFLNKLIGSRLIVVLQKNKNVFI
ncbi:MAG: methyltransferase domain-containing protein [bacterium]